MVRSVPAQPERVSNHPWRRCNADTCAASNQDPARPAKKALGSPADITAAVEQAIGRIAHRPEKVEMEFSASLTAECDPWIVSGEGEAELKAALAWGNGE